MKDFIPIDSLLNDDSLIEMNDFISIPKDGYSLLISPETGAWATLPNKDKYVLEFLSTPQTIRSIHCQHNPIFDKYLNELFYSGLIRVNDKDVLMIKRKENQKQNLPLFWVIKYTNACNLKCSYCYSYDKNKKNRLDLLNDYIYKISDIVGKTDNEEKLGICFHGGEPLIRFNDMVECVRELRKRRGNDVKFYIQTNGTLITPKVADFFKKEEFSVGISVDGYDSATNALRPFANNRPSIDKTIEGISNCVRIGLIPGIISVMTNKIHDKSVEIMKELSLLGIKSFHFNHFFPSGRGQNKEKELALSTEELLKTRMNMLLFINDHNESKGKQLFITERYSSNIIKSLISMGQTTYMCGQSPCGAGRRTLSINSVGDIFPCDDLGSSTEFKIANINEINDLYDTLAHSAIVKQCQNHCICNIPKCQSCLFKRICISHCCSDSYHYTGKFNSPHSACEFIQKFIPSVIDLIYRERIKVENFID